MKGNGKDKFYKKLKLDKDTRKILKWFKKVKDDMLNEKD